jgi:hypothetical protein
MIIFQTFVFAIISYIVLSLMENRKKKGPGRKILEIPKSKPGWISFLYPSGE